MCRTTSVRANLTLVLLTPLQPMHVYNEGRDTKISLKPRDTQANLTEPGSLLVWNRGEGLQWNPADKAKDVYRPNQAEQSQRITFTSANVEIKHRRQPCRLSSLVPPLQPSCNPEGPVFQHIENSPPTSPRTVWP